MSDTKHTPTPGPCSLCSDRGWYVAGDRIYQCKACNRFSSPIEAMLFVIQSYDTLLAVCEGFVLNERHMDDPELRAVRDKLFALARAAIAKATPTQEPKIHDS